MSFDTTPRQFLARLSKDMHGKTGGSQSSLFVCGSYILDDPPQDSAHPWKKSP